MSGRHHDESQKAIEPERQPHIAVVEQRGGVQQEPRTTLPGVVVDGRGRLDVRHVDGENGR